ncbi:MAG: TMEM165/GDT1 family protein [archaeon]|nr:TMEM165/GDT1 family protein [archaeon]
MDLTPLISSFSIVALAEFGDKTQLAAITLSTRYKPLYVFLGALFAVYLVDGISVLAGITIATFIPIFWINLGSGIAFIMFGILTLHSKDVDAIKVKNQKLSLITPFSLIALMELGDKTQVTVIALAAKYGTPTLIFLGIVFAYLIVMGVAVVIGSNLDKLVPIRYIRIGASVMFILFGILFLLQAITGATFP